MPKRIAKARQRKVELSEDQIDHLLSGYSLGPEFPFKDEAERRKAWTAHRAELMQYIGRTSGPGFYAQNGIPWGHRPAGWWQFEAPGTRRRIRGDMSITSIGEERSPSGTLRFWSEQVDDSEFETQHQFLKRHGLLSDTEQEQTA